NNFDFSFSGLKTAALYHLQKNPIKNEKELNDFCASLEESIVEVLTEKTIRAGLKYKTKSIILSGGVSANKYLRETLGKKTKEKLGLELMVPKLKYCMDNAVMIAIAGYYKAKYKKYTDWKKIKANPNWEIG
ncbi:MAG: tRNA (adenosine(37)-N6)-threonylcarbamoyltransferase complex transferase subunit TsaD, partial [Candidatus Magasanikbacteria bacterium]|nr:tRNA (adenosine(37)-N6)-threonylcarbamoyltransferase complex transferase subunit TsaD [Candidatus Magasanikbacteria bacterium]